MVSVSLKPSAQKYERDKRQEDAQKVTRQKELSDMNHKSCQLCFEWNFRNKSRRWELKIKNLQRLVTSHLKKENLREELKCLHELNKL
ncbi:Transposase [Caenorhabditis elegans]|uniref:Transposase n=1 Tax=Caenorhabditis elegans TaxID=6239 RepID=Q21708_CAEEL|nr:Transposase [Caenorhabditis elegans]CAA94847.2 Transposase [Caenorhabditis elegans]|eukprot:NP_505593.2 Uncharacterized protein CELE_R04B5.11 [Caenorhabditis elegans]